jgi:hypothetical protein
MVAAKTATVLLASANAAQSIKLTEFVRLPLPDMYALPTINVRLRAALLEFLVLIALACLKAQFALQPPNARISIVRTIKQNK